MIQRIQESLKIRAKYMFNRMGGEAHIPKHFIILSAPRVGSTLLHTYLNSHWNIISHGEFLGKEHRDGRTPDISRFYQKSTAQFITHTGCKVFYDYTRDATFLEALKKLYSDSNLYIIHLTRTDLISAYVSLVKAQESGEWTHSGPQDVNPIQVNPEELVSFLKDQERDQNEIPNQFDSQNQIQVNYEALVNRPAAELERIQQFLGLKPRRLHSVLKKQRVSDKWQLKVRNHEEIRQVLMNTRWAALVS